MAFLFPMNWFHLVYWPAYFISSLFPVSFLTGGVIIGWFAYGSALLLLRYLLKRYAINRPEIRYLDFDQSIMNNHYNGSPSKYLHAAIGMDSPWAEMRLLRLYDDMFRGTSNAQSNTIERDRLRIMSNEQSRKDTPPLILHDAGLDIRVLTDEALIDEDWRKAVARIIENSWGTKRAERRWILSNWAASLALFIPIYLFGLTIYSATRLVAVFL